MAKSKGGAKKKEKDARGLNIDLNSGPVNPVPPFRHLTLKAIREAAITNRYFQLVLIFTVIGSCLRLYHLDFNSLWLDEASTLSFARQSVLGIWESTAGGEFNPPLFYWLEHFMLAFGNSEIVLRLAPAIAGILTIPVFYLLGREFMDKNTGIIAAAFLAVSPFHIYFSQEARAYSPALLFIGISLYFYIKAYRSGSAPDWILFGVFSALAFWTHFYSFILTGILVLFAFLARIQEFKKDLPAIKPLAFGVCTWIILCLPIIIATAQLFVIRTSAAPTYGIQGIDIIWQSILQFFGYNPAVAILLFLLFIVGLIQIYKSDRSWGLLFSVAILGTFLVSWALSYKMPMIPRYLIFLLPFFSIAVAAINKPVLSAVPNKSVVYLLIVVLVIINMPVLANYYSAYWKEDWRGFSRQLQTFTKDGDIVVVAPGYIRQPFDYYYSNSTDKTMEFGVYSAQELQNISDARNKAQVFIVLTGDITAADPSGKLWDRIKQNTTFIGQDTGIHLFKL